MRKFLTSFLLSLFALALPAQYKMANVVCFVKFADQANEVFTHDREYYELMFNDLSDGANSVRRFYSDMSYGNFDWESTIIPNIYVDSHNRNYFRKKSDSNSEGYGSLEMMFETRFPNLIKDMCAYLDDKLPEGIVVDANDDGYVDNVVIIICGDSEIGASHLLWPANNKCVSATATLQGKRVGNYLKVFDAANGFISGSFKPKPLDTGVICHEMMHTLDAYDLYSNATPKINPVGVWDLMSDNQTVPQSFTAYMRHAYGAAYGDWLPESRIATISESGDYKLPSLNSRDAATVAYKILPEKGGSHYYMLEYRDASTIWDESLPNHGLLVYRVDPTVNGNLGAACEVYVFRPGGSATKAGQIAKAPLGSSTGRTSFGDDVDEDYPFGPDGVREAFAITDVTETASGVSFKVRLGESGVEGVEVDKTELYVAADGTIVAPGAKTVEVYDIAGIHYPAYSESLAQAPVGLYILRALYPDGTARTLRLRR